MYHRITRTVLIPVLLTGCGADGAMVADAPPLRLEVISGNDQRSDGGTALPQPLVIRVRDADGRPVAAVPVRFAAEDGGTLMPAEVQTDATGLARSRWTLGPAVVPGQVHRASASFVREGRILSVQFVARSDDTPPPQGIRALPLTTYDGSGQTVHPDVLVPSGSIVGTSPWLLAITPYPWGNATYENPSVFTGVDEFRFLEPRSGLNPIARPAAGHLSDPDVVRDPITGRIRLYYREASDRNRIWLTESLGIDDWSTPRLVVSGANHTIISPSVVQTPAGEWLMYAIDGEFGCSAQRSWLTVRRSADGVTWGAAQRVTLDQPGFSPWHVDVQWIPERQEYWAMYNVKTAGECATPALYVATSRDGIRWTTHTSPVLARGTFAPFADIVYRASFHYDGARDLVTIWHSGARYEGSGYRWSSAVESVTASALFERVRRKSTGWPPGTPGAPPLTQWP